MTSRQLLACTITEVFEYIVYTSLLAVCLMCIKNRYIILKPGTYNFLCVNNQIKKFPLKCLTNCMKCPNCPVLRTGQFGH